MLQYAQPYTKEQQTHKQRIKLTQRQKGAISSTVRREVKDRSLGACEVQMCCTGSQAVHMAHVTSRKQIETRTTAKDILHSCLACHKFLDETPQGIIYKRKLLEELK